MAMVSQGYRAVFTLGDVGRQKFSRGYELRDTTADFLAALAATVALETDLNNVTECTVIGYTVAEDWRDDTVGFPSNPVGERQNNAKITATIEDKPLKTATLMIPGPIDAMFVGAPSFSGYDTVDGANGLLIAFMDNFKFGAGTFSVSDGEQIADSGSFDSGIRVHRGSKKG